MFLDVGFVRIDASLKPDKQEKDMSPLAQFVNQRKHPFLRTIFRLLKDSKSLSGSVRIYYSWYAVSFKPTPDISYIHQNLQLKTSATYPFFLVRQEFVCFFKYGKGIPFELPQMIFSAPHLAIAFFIVFKHGRQQRGVTISQGFKLSLQENHIKIHNCVTF